MTISENRQPAPADDAIDLLELVAALWAGKGWIIVSCLVALLIGAFLVYRTEPTHQAQGLLQLEARSGALALPEGMQELLGETSGSGNSPANTEMEILKSRMVMAQVVEQLDLQVSAQPRPLPVLGVLPDRLNLPDPGIGILTPYRWGNESIRVGELEVPEAWLGDEMVLTLTGPDSYKVALPDGRTVEGRLRERLSLADAGFSLVVDELTGPVGREFLLRRLALANAVAQLQRNFSVVETPRLSSILRVTFTARDPRGAEEILDAISQTYVAQNITRSAAEAQNSLTFIEEQLPIAERAVLDAQNALNAYRQQQQSVDVDYETRILLERATQIETELNALALEEEEIRKRYTVNHPTYQALLENRAALERQLDEIRTATTNLPETQKEIFNLSRNLEVAQQIYVQLLNRAQELRVVQASTVGSVRIIDTAYSSGIPVSPRASLAFAMSLFLGGMTGVAIILIRRALRRGIRGAQEIEQMGLPVFATVGYSADAASLQRQKGSLPILAGSRPDDIVIEALRSLRTSLHFGMLDARTNTILFTSAAPAAGKSFTAVNLAYVAAQAGQRVCLVDADMRKGYIRRYFGGAKNAPGLAEVLAREAPLEQVLVKGPLENLSVLFTGRYPPNPSELLMRKEFDDLLQTLHGMFDLIIIDSPPALAVTDPVIIGRLAGAVILVARHLETMPGEIDAVRRAFETSGSRLTGAVLNGYKASEGSRYGGRYHYYNYRYSYRSERS